MEEKKKTNVKYIQAYAPDKLKLAFYINQAKGHDRNMAEFAAACGKVSASTFSRIVNKKIEKPISEDLIRAIIKNAANPEQLDFESFMRANGMVPEEEYKQEKEKEEINEKSRAIETQLDMEIKNIIADELYARGHMLRVYPVLPVYEFSSFGIPKSRFGFKIASGFAIRIQGYDSLYRNFIMSATNVLEADEMEDEDKLSKYLEIFMNRCSSLFLSDAWEPETLKDVMNVFVFTHKKAYDRFKEMIEGIKVNSDMSMLLVDVGERKVLEEMILPTDKKNKMTSIFDEEIVGFEM